VTDELPGGGATSVAPPEAHVTTRVQSPGWRRYTPWLVYAAAMLGLAVALFFFATSAYWVNLYIMALLFAGLASAWNIIGGFGGQFSLGHAMFFATGAYTVALLHVTWGISPWLGLVPAVIAGVAVAALISWPTFRLRGPFFAIATLALNEAAFLLTNFFDGITNGPRGILVPFEAGFVNMMFSNRLHYGLLMLAYLALVVGLSLAIFRGRLGYQLRALRDNEEAAEASGINVFRTKMAGMAISAGLTSVGGSLFVMYVRFIDPPTTFSLPDVGVRVALLALIGGVGTVPGPVLGAFLIQPGASFLRGELGEFRPGTHLAVLGLLLVLAALFMKRGILGLAQERVRRFRQRSRR
jgi:branched-chain amino acid transport system permease protein